MTQIKRLLIFTAIMTVFCGGYVLFAPWQRPLPDHTWRHEGGELLGSTVVWLFVVLYGRTTLKILLRQGPMLDRLLPEGIWNNALPGLKGVLPFLNKTHAYVGAAAVLLVFGHALIEGLQQANLLMQIVLALVVWQFGFGMFLLSRYQVVFVQKMKRYSYMAHSQLYTGIALGVCVLFGHVLFTD